MGKKKIIGNCAIEGCTRPLDSRGWCTMHYHRWRKNGTTDLVHRWGKTKHPNISIWRERFGYGSMPIEWLDFKKFNEAVGIRPSENHYLRKIDPSKPYSKDNFKWLEYIKKQPDESQDEWLKRKWKRRKENKPSLEEYGKAFKALHRTLGLSLIEFSKLFLEKQKLQNNLCAICNKPETRTQKKDSRTFRLSLDHCHKTNKIRDLLCARCNTTLGRLEESIPLLQSMITYIQKHSD